MLNDIDLDISFLVRENSKLLKRVSFLEDKLKRCNDLINFLPFRFKNGEYVDIVFKRNISIDEMFDIIEKLRNVFYEDY